MRYRNLFFLFFAVFAFLGSVSSASASMTLEELMAFDTSASGFSGIFSTAGSVTKSGLTMWDYVVFGASGDYDYGVFLTTANFMFSSGDGTHFALATDTSSSGVYGYIIYHTPGVGFGTYYDDMTASDSYATDLSFGHLFLISSPSHTSQNVEFAEGACSNFYPPISYSYPTEYKMCSDYLSCSPVMAASSSCGGGSGGGGSATISCGASFDSVPGFIEDPFGFFTGLFNGVAAWFNCEYEAVLSSISGFISDAVSSIGGFFSDLTTSISDMLSGLFAPPEGYFEAKLGELQTLTDEKFGFLTAARLAVSDGIDSLGTSTTAPTVSGSFYGHSVHWVDFSLMNDFFSYFRTVMSGIMWLGCIAFLIRETSIIFKS